MTSNFLSVTIFFLFFLCFNKNNTVYTLFQFFTSTCNKQLSRGCVESGADQSNSRILKSVDSIHGTTVVGLNEFTEKKNDNFDLGDKSGPGNNTDLEGKNVQSEKNGLVKKIRSPDDCNAIREIQDIITPELEQTVMSSEEPEFVIEPKDFRKYYLDQSCRKYNNAASTHFSRRRRMLADTGMKYEPHIPQESSHAPPYNNAYHPENVGARNSRGEYPNNYAPNSNAWGSTPGHGRNSDNQFNGVGKILSDCKDTWESQLGGVKKFLTDYTPLGEIPLDGVKKIISDCKDLGELPILGVKKIISDCKDLGELPLLGVKKIISDCKDLGELPLLGVKKIMSDCMEVYGSQIENVKQLLSDSRGNHVPQSAGNGRNGPHHSSYYGNQHRGERGRNEPHYSGNHEYQNVRYGPNQSNYNDYYTEHYGNLGGSGPHSNVQYDSQYGEGNTDQSYDNSYDEYYYSGESGPFYNEEYGSQYGERSTNQSDYDEYYSEQHYTGGNVYQYNNGYESQYEGGIANKPSRSAYYEASYAGGETNASHSDNTVESKKEQPGHSTSSYTQNYGLQRGDLRRKTYGDRNNYGSEHRGLQSKVSHEEKDTETKTELLKEEKIQSVTDNVKEGTPDSKVEKPENKATGHTGNSQMNNTGLEKKRSGSKLHLDTKTDKKENTKKESGEKVHLSDISTKKYLMESKQDCDSKVEKPENKATGPTGNSQMNNTGLEKKRSGSKLHLDTKTDKKENTKKESGEKVHLSDISIKKNLVESKQDCDSKVEKPENKATGHTGNSQMNNTGPEKKHPGSKQHLDTKTDKKENTKKESGEKVHLSDISTKKNLMESKQDCDSKVEKPENKATGHTGNSQMNNTGLEKKRSGSKLHLDTKTDKKENTKKESGEKVHLSDISTKKNLMESKQDCDSKVEKPENKATGHTGNSQMNNTGLEKKRSGSKLHLDTKTDKKENTKKESGEKVHLSDISTKKNLMESKQDCDSKVEKPENRATGHTGNSQMNNTGLEKKQPVWKQHIDTKTDKKENTKKESGEKVHLSDISTKKNLMESKQDCDSKVEKPENKATENIDDLMKRLAEEENKLDDKNSSTSASISCSVPRLRPKNKSDSGITGGEKSVGNTRMSMNAGSTSIRKDLYDSKETPKGESTKSDNKDTQDLYSSSLGKYRSGSKLHLDTKTDKKENTKKESGEKVHLSDISTKKNLVESKQDCNSKIGKPENKATENIDDLMKRLAEEENKLDDKNSSTSASISCSVPRLRPKNKSDSGITGGEKSVGNTRMSMNAGSTSIRKDVYDSKGTPKGESTKSDNKGTQDLYSSSLGKYRSGSKLNLDEKADIKENTKKESGEKVHLSDISTKKNLVESKQDCDSKIEKPENKATGHMGNSQMNNTGLEKKHPGWKQHIDTKTDIKENTKKESEKVRIQSAGMRKNTTNSKLNANTKNNNNCTNEEGTQRKST
eukprot:XP_002258646.1 hypothetical protein, conserved in Plasmodium species [Plasmodium knowlesi strain H]